VYLKEGTYHTRLFRGPSTNGMKKWDGPSRSWPTPHTTPLFFPPEPTDSGGEHSNKCGTSHRDELNGGTKRSRVGKTYYLLCNGEVIELSTNKQHTLSIYVYFPCKKF
jgi:hypothetical protein